MAPSPKKFKTSGDFNSNPTADTSTPHPNTEIQEGSNNTPEKSVLELVELSIEKTISPTETKIIEGSNNTPEKSVLEPVDLSIEKLVPPTEKNNQSVESSMSTLEQTVPILKPIVDDELQDKIPHLSGILLDSDDWSSGSNDRQIEALMEDISLDTENWSINDVDQILKLIESDDWSNGSNDRQIEALMEDISLDTENRSIDDVDQTLTFIVSYNNTYDDSGIE